MSVPPQGPPVWTGPQPVSYVHQRPPGPYVFTQNLVSTLVLVGIIVFFIGTMVGTGTSFLKAPKYSDYNDYTDYQNAVSNYNNLRRDVIGTGNILIEIGGLLTCLGLLGGAIDNNKLDITVKIAFISAAISFVVTTIIVVIFVSRLSSIGL